MCANAAGVAHPFDFDDRATRPHWAPHEERLAGALVRDRVRDSAVRVGTTLHDSAAKGLQSVQFGKSAFHQTFWLAMITSVPVSATQPGVRAPIDIAVFRWAKTRPTSVPEGSMELGVAAPSERPTIISGCVTHDYIEVRHICGWVALPAVREPHAMVES